MTETVCIDIPREVLHASRMTPNVHYDIEDYQKDLVTLEDLRA